MEPAVIDVLNELLAAERAGVETLANLKKQYPNLKNNLESIENDEAWSCSGLIRCLNSLGGPVTPAKGDFAAKVQAQPDINSKLELLARGQQWVVKRLDAILARDVSTDIRSFLQQMKEAHDKNIKWCQAHVEKRP